MSQLKLMSCPSRTSIGRGDGALVIGIDPGVTRLGLHAELDRAPVANATYASDSSKGYTAYASYLRVQALAIEVCKWICSVAYRNDYPTIYISIETPIFNGRNPRAFELQWRLFQAILSTLDAETSWSYVLEVNNKTAKRIATGNGNAEKLDILLASPYDGPGEWNGAGTKAKEDYNANQEAIADAWAIAQCVYDSTAGIMTSCSEDLSVACRGPIVSNVMI